MEMPIWKSVVNVSHIRRNRHPKPGDLYRFLVNSKDPRDVDTRGRLEGWVIDSIWILLLMVVAYKIVEYAINHW